ncbi:MAG: argininosuccinate lyase [Eggerthellaceae bacterium]|nr:argininosuccinate lyase [Eggerthellaceae bacterium]
MTKMWAGRTDADTNELADELNSSIGVDCRMYEQDINGSMAHAAMLGAQGIITEEEANAIIDGLEGILADIESGALEIDMTAEDIHMFVEAELTARIGEAGKKVHTARSRNDQVALDLRMYLRDEIDEISDLVLDVMEAIVDVAEANAEAIMPGYTHLQRAQPVLFAHHILAYAMMLARDMERLEDCQLRMNVSPIGACALAGTTYPTDRGAEAELLGFDAIAANSIDAVSDRDFAAELAGVLSLLMMHLSRFSEELILWQSWEFKFIELDDAFTTGSSIMPQKKNPDMAELVRGKTARVYGDLMTLLTMLKGLPLAYNKDMQEDKEAIFDAVDTVKLCLKVFAPMVATMKVRADRMLAAAREGFINATDLADWLVGKSLAFRDAYKVSGRVVAACLEAGCTLETLPLETYAKVAEDVVPGAGALMDESLFAAIDLAACVARRTSQGGTSPESVAHQIAMMRDFLAGPADCGCEDEDCDCGCEDEDDDECDDPDCGCHHHYHAHAHEHAHAHGESED